MGAFCSLAQVTGVHRQSRDENDEIPVADALPCPDSLLDSLQTGSWWLPQAILRCTPVKTLLTIESNLLLRVRAVRSLHGVEGLRVTANLLRTLLGERGQRSCRIHVRHGKGGLDTPLG